MSRATDALQAGRDGRRRLDLDDEVDRAHVDAQLEAARRDDARQVAALERFLGECALLAADAAVMCTCDLWRRSLFELAVILARFQRGAVHAFIGNLIEPVGQPFCQPA